MANNECVFYSSMFTLNEDNEEFDPDDNPDIYKYH